MRRTVLVAVALIVFAHAVSDTTYGDVWFKTSCTVATNETFNNGIATLHSFAYYKARSYFNEVIKIDPNCTIAYWGLAMTQWYTIWQNPLPKNIREAAIKSAKDLMASTNTTEREGLYIRAVDQLFSTFTTHGRSTAAHAYEASMKSIFTRYGAEDIESAIFYALAVLGVVHVLPPAAQHDRRLLGGSLLSMALLENKYHPGALHYLIHMYDTAEMAPYALNAANTYAMVAPGIAHVRHMPSHTYIKLGMWKQSHTSNVDSLAFAENYEVELHSLSFIVQSLLQQGQFSNLEPFVHYVLYSRNTSGLYLGFETALDLTTIPMRVLLENNQYERAAEFKLEPEDFDWKYFGWPYIYKHYCNLVGYAKMRNEKDARASAEKMKAARVTAEIAPGWLDIYEEWKVELDELIATADAWVLWSQHKEDEAIVSFDATLQQYPDLALFSMLPPFREQFGDILFSTGKYKEAYVEYQRSIGTNGNRLKSVYGAAKSAQLVDDRVHATDMYQKLLYLCSEGAELECPNQVCKSRKYICNERKEFAEAHDYLSRISKRLVFDTAMIIVTTLAAILIVALVTTIIFLSYKLFTKEKHSYTSL